jgi:hypothetical protein
MKRKLKITKFVTIYKIKKRKSNNFINRKMFSLLGHRLRNGNQSILSIISNQSNQII